MAICKACGRDNQDLYKFCLGCGAELGDVTVDAGDGLAARLGKSERRAEAKSSNGEADDTDELRDRRDSLAHLKPMPQSDFDAEQPQTTPGTASSTRRCLECGAQVAAEFTFCGQCGARMDPDTKPESPRTRDMPGPLEETHGRLILIRPDGTEGGTHALAEGENIIGRGLGPLFDADGYLSPRHAELVLNAAGLVVRDAGSLNGIFVKLTGEEELVDGDVFRIGQELLRFDEIATPVPLDDGTDIMGSPNPGYWGRLALIVGSNQDGSAFPLFGDAVTLGRERGDILFPEDGYVSGQHARVLLRDGRFYLVDLNSSNGTFLRVRGERALPSGSSILMGQQLFRISY
jgi:pSer/pThr/pTyr-binding forkhead associated (FHA) protein